jgi:hypothetical protein
MGSKKPIAYTIHREGLELDIALVETRNLLLHEETIPESLMKLKKALLRDGVMKAPVIVDRESFVILDGMHRVTALKKIGCRFTCVCLVDYMNPEIKLDRWCRVVKNTISPVELMGKIRELGYSFETTNNTTMSKNEILLKIGNEPKFIKIKGQEVFHLFKVVVEIEKWLSKRGYTVHHYTQNDAEKLFSEGKASLVLYPPVIEKKDVINVATKGSVFTFKATRHIVPARPVGVNVPLELLKDSVLTVEEANNILRENLEGMMLKKITSGNLWWGRRYDEVLYVFEDF